MILILSMLVAAYEELVDQNVCSDPDVYLNNACGWLSKTSNSTVLQLHNRNRLEQEAECSETKSPQKPDRTPIAQVPRHMYHPSRLSSLHDLARPDHPNSIFHRIMYNRTRESLQLVNFLPPSLRSHPPVPTPQSSQTKQHSHRNPQCQYTPHRRLTRNLDSGTFRRRLRLVYTER